MTIILRALSVANSAAIAAIGGRLRLVQPPFTLASSAELGDADLSDAIQRCGYELATREFASYRDLVAFLRHAHEDWANKMGFPLGGSVSAVEFISEIDAAIARDVLNRIDNDLISAGLYDQAQELLLAIIQSRDLKEVQDVQERAVSLLARCHEHRGPERASLKSRVTDKRFHTLQDDETKCKVQEIKHKIQERHCVLAIQATV
jgi:hypothetical protein